MESQLEILRELKPRGCSLSNPPDIFSYTERISESEYRNYGIRSGTKGDVNFNEENNVAYQSQSGSLKIVMFGVSKRIEDE
jgi:hypothetical protein